MGKILIDRPLRRKGLWIAKGMSKSNPGILFPFYEKLEDSELDELIRAILAKGGVTDEAEVNAVIEQAEKDYEVRVKISEAKAEVRRLMSIRARGISLIQRGYRKWVAAFMPPRTVFKS